MNSDSQKKRKPLFGIFPRAVLFSLSIVVLVLAAFAVTIVEREERLLLQHLESRAQLLAASVDRVCANAIVAEEQWTVVEQFQKMVDISSEVRYAVITRQSDGESIVFTEGAWRVEVFDSEFWKPSTTRNAHSFISQSSLIPEEVLHFAYPFSYENYEWGWIHVGMSLSEYRTSLEDVYRIIMNLTIPSLLLGVVLSFLFARQLTLPIAKIRVFASRIASGDLDQRVELKSRDEVGDLADSLNSMAGKLTLSMKRERELREKDVLLKEIHHRVKNNMQILSSLLRLQSRRMKNEEMQGFVIQSESRIRSMGLIHEKLYQSNNLSDVDFEDYAGTLTNELRRMYSGTNGEVSFKLDIEDVKLSLDTALPCGLILNELVSNSFKYAFPNGHPGVVTVKMRHVEDDAYEFVVSDNGVGMDEADKPDGESSFGTRLVETLVRQINGELETVNGDGVTTKILFHESQYEKRL